MRRILAYGHRRPCLKERGRHLCLRWSCRSGATAPRGAPQENLLALWCRHKALAAGVIDGVSIRFLLSQTFLKREEEQKAKEQQEETDIGGSRGSVLRSWSRCVGPRSARGSSRRGRGRKGGRRRSRNLPPDLPAPAQLALGILDICAASLLSLSGVWVLPKVSHMQRVFFIGHVVSWTVHRAPPFLAARCSASRSPKECRTSGRHREDGCASRVIGSTVDTRASVNEAFTALHTFFHVKVDEPSHLAALARCLCCLRSLFWDLFEMFCGYTLARQSTQILLIFTHALHARGLSPLQRAPRIRQLPGVSVT